MKLSTVFTLETSGSLDNFSAAAFTASLRALIAHCLEPGAGGLSPSEFPLAGLDAAALDPLVAATPGAIEDLYPTSSVQRGMLFHALHSPGSGVYVGQFSLEEMWRTVDRIRIGAHGYAMVLAANGELVAHGDPDKKALVAQARNMGMHPLLAALRAAGNSRVVSSEYADETGQTELGVAATLAPLG